jgi:hypothetical protein
MLVQLLFVLLIIALIWLGYVTYILQKTKSNFNLFTKNIDKKNLEEALVYLVHNMQGDKKDIAKLIERCDTIEKNAQFAIQKISLLRFNPFKDTGGDQSFILALVDAQDSGIVITALYSRTGMRWYAKRVVKGIGFEHELSNEEKKAIKMAKGIE